jgi:hypothetical protein
MLHQAFPGRPFRNPKGAKPSVLIQKNGLKQDAQEWKKTRRREVTKGVGVGRKREGCLAKGEAGAVKLLTVKRRKKNRLKFFGAVVY